MESVKKQCVRASSAGFDQSSVTHSPARQTAKSQNSKRQREGSATTNAARILPVHKKVTVQTLDRASKLEEEMVPL